MPESTLRLIHNNRKNRFNSLLEINNEDIFQIKNKKRYAL